MNRPPAALMALVRSGEARRLRKDAEISIGTMAAGLRMVQGNLSQYERARRYPPPGQDRAWLRVLSALQRHEQAFRGSDDP